MYQCLVIHGEGSVKQGRNQTGQHVCIPKWYMSQRLGRDRILVLLATSLLHIRRRRNIPTSEYEKDDVVVVPEKIDQDTEFFFCGNGVAKRSELRSR